MADEPTGLLDELRKLDEALIRANWFTHSVTVLNAIQLIRLLHGETTRLKAAGAAFSAQQVQRTCDYEERIEALTQRLDVAEAVAAMLATDRDDALNEAAALRQVAHPRRIGEW